MARWDCHNYRLHGSLWSQLIFGYLSRCIKNFVMKITTNCHLCQSPGTISCFTKHFILGLYACSYLNAMNDTTHCLILLCHSFLCVLTFGLASACASLSLCTHHTFCHSFNCNCCLKSDRNKGFLCPQKPICCRYFFNELKGREWQGKRAWPTLMPVSTDNCYSYSGRQVKTSNIKLSNFKCIYSSFTIQNVHLLPFTCRNSKV